MAFQCGTSHLCVPAPAWGPPASHESAAPRWAASPLHILCLMAVSPTKTEKMRTDRHLGLCTLPAVYHLLRPRFKRAVHNASISRCRTFPLCLCLSLLRRLHPNISRSTRSQCCYFDRAPTYIFCLSIATATRPLKAPVVCGVCSVCSRCRATANQFVSCP